MLGPTFWTLNSAIRSHCQAKVCQRMFLKEVGGGSEYKPFLIYRKDSMNKCVGNFHFTELKFVQKFSTILSSICLINLSLYQDLRIRNEAENKSWNVYHKMESKRFSKLNLWRFSISLFAQGNPMNGPGRKKEIQFKSKRIFLAKEKMEKKSRRLLSNLSWYIKEIQFTMVCNLDVGEKKSQFRK